MNIKPFNRYLLVTPIEEAKKEENLSIILPTDYQKPVNPHVMCKIHSIARDSKLFDSLKKNDTVVVERRMLNKIEFGGKTSYLVLENYIYGSIREWN